MAERGLLRERFDPLRRELIYSLAPMGRQRLERKGLLRRVDSDRTARREVKK